MHVTQKTSQHRFCSLTWPSNICFIRGVLTRLANSRTSALHTLCMHTDKMTLIDTHVTQKLWHAWNCIKQIVISNIRIKYIRKVVIKEFRIYLYNKYISVLFSLCFYARDRALMLQCHSHLVNVLVSEQILW